MARQFFWPARAGRFASAAVAFFGLDPGISVPRDGRLDSFDWRALFAGHRRHQLSLGYAHYASGSDFDSVVLERDQDADEGILHTLSPAAGGHAGRFHGARFLPLLFVLGSDARAHVLPDWGVGQRPPPVRGDQV